MICAYNYLDNLLNIDTNYVDQMVHRTYPAELQLNKAKSSDTEAACLDVNFPIVMASSLLKYMMNGMILIQLISRRSLMAMSLYVFLMVLISTFALPVFHVSDFNGRNESNVNRQARKARLSAT